MASTNIVTPTGTLSFPQLFTPKPRSEGAKPVYSCTILFDTEAQSSVEYKAMQTACLDAAKLKFGANVNLKQVLFPFRDAAEKSYKGYDPGKVFINPWSESQPTVVDEQVQDVINPSLIYAGQNVRAYVVAKGWLNSGKKGVSFYLNGLQIVDHKAPRIDDRINAKSIFKPIEDTDSPF
jgi:hypothetical protein